MTLTRGQWEYNPTMLSSTVVRVRIPPLLDAATYISLGVMSLLAARGVQSLQARLLLFGLCAIYGLLYWFVFRTGRYEKSPVLYFGSQYVVLVLLLFLRTSTLDAINFIYLFVSIHAALVLTRNAASLWIAAYYLTLTAAVFITRGANGFYAAVFYLVIHLVCGVFGRILQQAELAREHNQQLIEELKSTQPKLQELAVMEERNRLARDLHDSVKQQVFAISMQLSAARTALSETDKAHPSVVEAERLAQQASAELTTLIHELRPRSLERKSLTDAIREHVEEWSRRNKIESEMKIDSDVSVNVQTEQALFRVLQEALANVARHSKADKVTVELKSDENAVTLSIADNGVGFDSKQIARGIGLDSMQERLIAVNGKVEVISEKLKGTRVVAKVRRS
jgi:signal transduction histidine kinase